MKEHEFEPFERVLVREEDNHIWRIDFFNSMRNQLYGDELYVCLAGAWHQCVPYEGNEHLLGTTDDPEPDFKFGDKVEVRNSENEDWIKGIFFSNGHLHDYPFSVILEGDNFLVDWKYCRHADW